MNAPADIKPVGLDLLRQPFPEHHISKLPKETRKQIDERKNDNSCVVWKCEVCGGAHHKKAVHLDYVGHAALTDRLLDTDPEWFWEPLAIDEHGLPAFDQRGGLWIKLTVCGVTRLGYGCADGKSGGDAIKEIIGDALRNAAMRFGAALDLWHKGNLHIEDAADEDGEAREMPDAEWAHMVQLIEATGKAPIIRTKMMKKYQVQNLKLLNQDQYSEAIDVIKTFIADKVKAETNAKAKETNFGELVDDEIPY